MEINKVLFLLRHGEASPSSGYGQDFSRPLNGDGINQLNRLSRTLKTNEVTFDLVLSSSAKRTLETTEIITKMIPSKKIIPVAGLYEADPLFFLNLINKTPSEVRYLLIVAHNPAISALAADLSSESFLNLKPGMMVKIDLYQDKWEAVGKHTGYLAEVLL
jgi:phosphohistidine phosphatase